MLFPANSLHRIQLDADTILTQTYRLRDSLVFHSIYLVG